MINEAEMNAKHTDAAIGKGAEWAVARLLCHRSWQYNLLFAS
jgi:hypothetical protein